MIEVGERIHCAMAIHAAIMGEDRQQVPEVIQWLPLGLALGESEPHRRAPRGENDCHETDRQTGLEAPRSFHRRLSLSWS